MEQAGKTERAARRHRRRKKDAAEIAEVETCGPRWGMWVGKRSTCWRSSLREDQERLRRATAWAAMARPRPISSTPSLVVAFRPISSGSRPVDFARAAFIAARCG